VFPLGAAIRQRDGDEEIGEASTPLLPRVSDGVRNTPEASAAHSVGRTCCGGQLRSAER